MRLLWPVDGRAWTASYWWFLGMIVLFTAARLILVTTGVPRTRVRLFRPPPRDAAGQDVIPVSKNAAPGPDIHGRAPLGANGALWLTRAVLVRGGPVGERRLPVRVTTRLYSVAAG